ncbi:MAG: InlB B-repeat-containing protein [Candidatus Moraniibacteriota bacterium]
MLKISLKYVLIISAIAVCSFYGRTALAASNVESFETGGCSAIACSYAGNYPYWYASAVAGMPHGSWGMGSGRIGDNQYTDLVGTIGTLAGTVGFYYIYGTEGYFDNLIFYIDGVEKGRWSGPTTGWNYVSYAISAGVHELRWRYSKDGSVSANGDMVGIDYVVFSLPSLYYYAGGGGYLSGTATQMVSYNGSGSAIYAYPYTGYHFVNWSDGSTANPRTDSGVTSDRYSTANFAINTYSLNYYAGGGGSVSGATSQTVNYGASGSGVTANPSAGYHFVNWSDGSTANPRTDSSVTGNISVTANFTNTAPVLGSGTINTSPVVTNGSTQYQITVTANETDAGGGANITDQLALLNYAGTNAGAYRGYLGFSLNGNFPHFGGAYYQSPMGCSGGGQAATYNGYGSSYINLVSCSTSVSGNTRTTTFNTAFNSSFTTPLTSNNITIYVSDAQGAAAGWQASNTFNIQTYTLAYAAGANGTLSGTTFQTVTYGTSGTAVTANPSTGYHFVNWSDGSTANPRTDSSVTASKSVTANFAINTYAITVTQGSNGTISPGTTTKDYGTSQAFSITPSTGYHVVSVTADGSNQGAISSYTFSNIQATHTITASYVINTYALAYTAGSNGTLSGTVSQSVDHGSSGTAVTANPSTGYHFVDWSDSSTQNPRTDAGVTGNVTVTANFAINTYALTYTAGSNGTLSGTASQSIAHGSSGTAVTANPSTGYHFVDWSDSSTQNPRTDINVTADISVTANFVIDNYTITFNKNTGDTEANPTTRTADYNTTVTLPTAPTKTGYTFTGWNTIADGSGTTFSSATAVTGNLTVYAQWTINNYTITFNKNTGDTEANPTTRTADYNTTVTLPTAPTKTGYTFTGWNTIADGSGTTFSSATAVTGNLTAYAQWTVNSYTITFDKNGGDAEANPTTKTTNYNTTITLPTAPTKAGYALIEWNTLSDGSGTAFTGSTAVTGDLTVYAQWGLMIVPTITNSTGATEIGFTDAIVHCDLTDDGNASTTVYLYWGNNDGGTTTGNWDNSVDLGVRPEGARATALSGLNSGINYFYRCLAINSIGEDWADSTASFTTVVGSNSQIIFGKSVHFLQGLIFK